MEEEGERERVVVSTTPSERPSSAPLADQTTDVSFTQPSSRQGRGSPAAKRGESRREVRRGSLRRDQRTGEKRRSRTGSLGSLVGYEAKYPVSNMTATASRCSVSSALQ